MKSEITEEYFLTLSEYATDIISFLQKLKDNLSLKEFLKGVKGLESKSNEKAINDIFIIDLFKCFNLIKDLDSLNNREFFAIIYVCTNLLSPHMKEISYSHRHLYVNSFHDYYSNLIKENREACQLNIDSDEKYLNLSYFLSHFDKQLQEEYLSKLYRFTSIVVKADGVVSKREEDALKKIMRISNRKEQDLSTSTIINKGDENLEDILKELDNLIGLESLKEEIISLINFLRIQQAREKVGLKTSSVSYHLVLTGNPGTGKTTVARLISRIYKSLGILTNGHMVETDRSGLVAGYVGQTAMKVNQVIDSAINGILFIDEAYSLTSSGDFDYGKEAVSTLIKRMEDDRDKLVIIIAGYTKPMETFIESNPGFKSRFNRFLSFNDYTPKELLEIFVSFGAKIDYNLSEEAKLKATLIFEEIYNNRSDTFGNARDVRNIFETTLQNQANRLASVTQLTHEVLSKIEASDIPNKIAEKKMENISQSF